MNMPQNIPANFVINFVTQTKMKEKLPNLSGCSYLHSFYDDNFNIAAAATVVN